MMLFNFFRRSSLTTDIPVFVDLTSDYGFKAIFGNEANKDVLLALLRLLIPDEDIAAIEYIDKEKKGLRGNAKACFFDVYCKSADGKRIIIEMQSRSQKFFLSRSVFYSTFAIQDQLKRGLKDYDFAPVYMVSFVCEDIDEFSGRADFITRVNLYTENEHRLVVRNLNYIFVELNKFGKTEEDLSEDNDLDGLLYSIKHMSKLTEIPHILRKPLFRRLYEASRFAAMSAAEQYRYIRTMTTKADIRAQINYSFEKGMEKGVEQGIEKVAKSMKENGMPTNDIAKITGLSEEEISKL